LGGEELRKSGLDFLERRARFGKGASFHELRRSRTREEAVFPQVWAILAQAPDFGKYVDIPEICRF
jgi:hypothetical protein